MKKVLIIIFLVVCSFCYGQKGFKTSTVEALLKGKKVSYDACSERSFKDACAYYKGLKYIGSGYIYFINGVKNRNEKLTHFFIGDTKKMTDEFQRIINEIERLKKRMNEVKEEQYGIKI